tara:strand:+ start:3007 stop:3498 length:492 start_codon:yes stop_codon:yes gene_type:complete
MIKIDQIYTAYIQAGREHTDSNIKNLYRPYRDTTISWDKDVIEPLAEFVQSGNLPIKNHREIHTKYKNWFKFVDSFPTKFKYNSDFDIIRKHFPQERHSDNTGEFLKLTHGLLTAYIEARAAMEGKRHKEVSTKFAEFFHIVEPVPSAEDILNAVQLRKKDNV